MSSLQTVIAVQGLSLLILACTMGAPALVEYFSHSDSGGAFLSAAAVTFVAGGSIFLSSFRAIFRPSLSYRDSFLIAVGVWIVIAAFSALPFVFALPKFSYIDAFFESVSGVTTTGSTVIGGLDTLAPGLLVWRSFLQWIGGIGIVLTTILIFPLIRVGGMHLFHRVAGQAEKVVPRMAHLIGWLVLIYTLMTLSCAALYWLFDMTLFDAVNHAMTTVATGGFSTHDDSFGFFNDARIEAVAVLFMMLGSMPFVLYLHVLLGKPRMFYRDEQVLWFILILLACCAIAFFSLIGDPHRSLLGAVRTSLFNATSIMTGTGYASEDYASWGDWSVPLFLFMMLIGGCAGSTSCGIKIFRIIVLYKTAALQMRQMLEPQRVFVMQYNRQPIASDIGYAVMGYFFILFVFFGLLSICLGFTGLDFVTAISGSATALANVGPGLGGVIGPEENFASLPDSAKLLMTGGMLLGRLEFFAILMLFAPRFWKR